MIYKVGDSVPKDLNWVDPTNGCRGKVHHTFSISQRQEDSVNPPNWFSYGAYSHQSLPAASLIKVDRTITSDCGLLLAPKWNMMSRGAFYYDPTAEGSTNSVTSCKFNRRIWREPLPNIFITVHASQMVMVRDISVSIDLWSCCSGALTWDDSLPECSPGPSAHPPPRDWSPTEVPENRPTPPRGDAKNSGMHC